MAEHPGPAIRAARTRASTTLRVLADAIGVSVGTMSAIETAKVALTTDRLDAIAAVLGVRSADLLEPPPERVESPALATGERPSWRRFDELHLDPALRAAIEVFTEFGYHGATMRMVATAADSSVAGIYHYHRSKQGLLVTLANLTIDDLEWRVAAADAAGDTPAARFGLMVEALALFHASRRDLALITATEMRSLEEPDRARIVGRRRAIQSRLDAAAVAAVS
ncbi:MAG: TetR family transcriptional regulator, partial [Gordonia amarae]